MLSTLGVIGSRMPPPLRSALRSARAYAYSWRNRNRDPRDVFDEVYERHMWGGAAGDYSSGPGSDPAHATPYVSAVGEIISTRDIRTVVDIGCGDFRIGGLIAPLVDGYTGVDASARIIERNTRLFGSATTHFLCADAVAGALPDGDLCLIRQVFQHLSNSQIQKILDRLSIYRWIVVSDGYFAGARRANMDKPQGHLSRQAVGSYISLADPPFNVRDLRCIAEMTIAPFDSRGEEIVRSYLFPGAQFAGRRP
jgi:SAM-dependent methyltransferase